MVFKVLFSYESNKYDKSIKRCLREQLRVFTFKIVT